MPSGPQIRAARALLGISAEELAELSGVPHRTLQRFERNDEVPPSRIGNLDKIKTALEAEGIQFIGDPVKSPGVQLKHKRS